MTRHYLDTLADVIRENWDKPALTDYATLDGGPGNSYTYGQMYVQILALCDRFRQLGLKPGDHIAICGVNSANWVISYVAIAAFRGVSVPIMQTMPAKDILAALHFADTKALLADEALLLTLKTAVTNIAYINLDSLPQVGSVFSKMDVSFETADLDSLATLCFTSGSTGTPKAAMLSYRAISNGAIDGIHILPITHEENYAFILPLAHVFGMITAISQLECVNHSFMLDMVAPSEIAEVMQRVNPFVIMTVPMVIEFLYKIHGDQLMRAFGTCARQLIVGGSAMNPILEEKLHQAKIPIVLLYGATEGLEFSGNRWGEYRRKSSGKAVPGMFIRIAPNGEILVRGENVMLGYYKDPDATAAKIDADGWLHTGDRGHLDEDGYLYVEGRLEQDMIVLPSGENISPVKVESIINACDGVEESIVIARNGKLMALVVMHDLPQFSERSGFREHSEQELRNHLLAQINPQLPAYSQLFGLEFLSEPLARTEKKTIKRYLYK